MAESCTAGLVAARLADIPGSSDVLLGGVIAYANEVKQALLGVPEELLAEFGAVSEECARAMAAGARAATGAEVGIAVTGVAGPGGGTERKPVGLVYLHVSAPGAERGQELRLPGDRAQVRELAAVAALQLVRTTLSVTLSRRPRGCGVPRSLSYRQNIRSYDIRRRFVRGRCKTASPVGVEETRWQIRRIRR